MRQAAEQSCGAATLLYYGDYPYAQQAGAVEKVIGANPVGWRSEVAVLSAAAIQAKIEAIGAFQSQLSTFFVNSEDLDCR